MNIAQQTTKLIDSLEKRNAQFRFVVAVIKKYNADQAGNQAALLTYYAFVSLFPLLLIFTTAATIIANSQPHLQQTITTAVTNYFPLLGNQLSAHIHSLHKSGLALAIGLILLLYGARGVADAFRNGVNTIWRVPHNQRDGFPTSLIKSLVVIVVGGIGFTLASLTAGFASTAGHGWYFRVLSIGVDFVVLYWVFNFLIEYSLSEHWLSKDKNENTGAVTAALGLVILQNLGSYLLLHVLKNLDALYSYFALALGLMFWLYLQAQVLYYAMEIATVLRQKSRLDH